jgi:hypothetical protein
MSQLRKSPNLIDHSLKIRVLHIIEKTMDKFPMGQMTFDNIKATRSTKKTKMFRSIEDGQSDRAMQIIFSLDRCVEGKDRETNPCWRTCPSMEEMTDLFNLSNSIINKPR